MKSFADLRRRAERARAADLPPAFRDVARRALLAWIDAAATHDMPLKEALRRLRDGEAALEAGNAALAGQLADPKGPAARAACASGCAFCCILSGADGGMITGAEATRLHAALAPLAGEPDGRDWHDKACPALDPESRRCRAYDARPMICRSFISDDADSCERIAAGEAATGPGVLGGYPLALSVFALTREALRGTIAVPTYSLARVAASSVEGADLTSALGNALHPPRELRDELSRQKVP